MIAMFIIILAVVWGLPLTFAVGAGLLAIVSTHHRRLMTRLLLG